MQAGPAEGGRTSSLADALDSGPRRLIVSLLAFALGGLGQAALFRRNLPAAGILYLLATIVFVTATRALVIPRAFPSTAGAEPLVLLARSAAHRLVAALLLSGAVAACAFSLVLFGKESPAAGAWGLHLLAVALFVTGVAVLFPAPRDGPRLSRRGALLLASILVLAGGLRLYKLGTEPFGCWWDEANNGIVAQGLVAAGADRPVYSGDTQLPTHFFYIVGLFFKVFGPGLLALRLVTAAFGIGTVFLAFLVGREVLGERFGFVFAFFLAVGRWDLTFSRIGLVAIPAPFFGLLTLLFLFRILRTASFRDFALAGITFGFGLCFYYAYRLMVPVLGLFFLAWAVWVWRSHRPGRLAALFCGVLAFGAGTVLAAAPVGQFALKHPELFGARTSQVSIFNHRDEPDLKKAIALNTKKHLLMFNQDGDRNGRHNLPGAPMLDPAMAVLFVLGLGLVLTRSTNPVGLLFLATFGSGLLGGILSLDFEAPQSVRSIVALPAVFFFAALALEGAWRAAETGGRVQRAFATASALLLIACIAVSNAYTYFHLQLDDDAAWAAHCAVETIGAHRIQEAARRASTIYATLYIQDHIVVRFLDPKVKDTNLLQPQDGLPLRDVGDRPVTIVVDSENTWALDEARQIYPNAQVLVDSSPSGRPMVHTILISPEEIRRVQGLRAQYFSSQAPDGPPILTRSERQLDGALVHDPLLLASPWVARWDGVLIAPRWGDFELVLDSPSSSSLRIDDKTVLDEGSGERHAIVRLPEGRHLIRVTARNGERTVRLAWRQPVTASEPTSDLQVVPSVDLFQPTSVSVGGLVGDFYRGTSTSGPIAFSRVDPFLDSYFHYLPLERPYTVLWHGFLDSRVAGQYEIGLRAEGKAELWLDGQLVLSVPEPTDYAGSRLYLSAGPHAIRVRFLDYIDTGSRIHLYWTPPGGQRQIVPTDALRPYP
jgi:hypothetical protein